MFEQLIPDSQIHSLGWRTFGVKSVPLGFAYRKPSLFAFATEIALSVGRLAAAFWMTVLLACADAFSH